MKLSSRLEKQEPIQSRSTGCRKRSVTSAPPTLKNVVEADLGDDRRLETLFCQAVERRWVSDCGSDRLNFWAAAEHARAVGQRNVPGLFVWVVKDRRWGFITQRDEDLARLRMAQTGSQLKPQAHHRVSRETWTAAGAICTSVLSRLAAQRFDSTIRPVGMNRTPLPLAEHSMARRP